MCGRCPHAGISMCGRHADTDIPMHSGDAHAGNRMHSRQTHNDIPIYGGDGHAGILMHSGHDTGLWLLDLLGIERQCKLW